MTHTPHVMHLTHRQSRDWFNDRNLRQKIKRTAHSRSLSLGDEHGGLAVYVANLPGWAVFLAHAAIVSSRLKTSRNGNKGSFLRAC